MTQENPHKYFMSKRNSFISNKPKDKTKQNSTAKLTTHRYKQRNRHEVIKQRR